MNSDQIPNSVSYASTATRAPAAQQATEFITFTLGDEEYGIPVLCVQEIRSYEPPTHIANAPPALRGILNLRGLIVPVVDLRVMLDCRAALDQSTIVIVLRLPHHEAAVVVDAVGEVMRLKADDVRPPADLSSSIRLAPYIGGIGTVDDRMLILLNIERWMLSADMALLALH